MWRLRTVCVPLLALALAVPAMAQDAVPTTVVVRAVSNDAKLVQDPVGGAHITIAHAETGEVLAEGRQTGDSGSTDKIMPQAHDRGASIFEVPGVAKYLAISPLEPPTPLTITVPGLLDHPHPP